MTPPAQAVPTQRSRPSLVHRLFRRRPVPMDIHRAPDLAMPSGDGGDGPTADAHTRGFWSAGVQFAGALVETGAGTHRGSRERVAALIAAHDAGLGRGEARRPRGNPAFSEALFIELMRAHQYGRAFEQLSTDCQRSWGSADAFVAAQGASAMRRPRGAPGKDVGSLAQ